MFQQDTPVDIQKRLPFLAGFIIFFTVVILVRLWYLQAIKGDYYHEQAESNRIRPVKLRPPRGIIYDRHGRPRTSLRSISPSSPKIRPISMQR